MDRFDYFVVFAEMRTGSNFLEANINMFADLACVGEAFNPHFVGYPDQPDLFGVTQEMREKNPEALIDAVKAADGLCGFRYFNDHDPRVFDICMKDPRCAKIILTRNPAESFVSWKIAAATGQWKLTNVNHAKSEKITFDLAEFETHLETVQAFQVKLLNGLQRTGQTAFYVAYEDLQDVDVMNGLAMFLGSAHTIKNLNKKLKKQNPSPMSSKVDNFHQMEAALSRLDRFNLNRTPNFEPRRGPMIPSYVAAPESGLLFMPLRSCPNPPVRNWLAQLDGKTPKDLITQFSQQSLRAWKRSHVGHRSFTVLRHPVARAHMAFCRQILGDGADSYPELRATLRKVHRLPVPENGGAPVEGESYDLAAHRVAFLAFLNFLKGNLSAQTGVRVDAAWATQLSILQGMSEFGLPDLILREENLRYDLALLAGQIGKTHMPEVPSITDPLNAQLAAIYDDEIEGAAQQAYARDYVGFGFGPWRPQAA